MYHILSTHHNHFTLVLESFKTLRCIYIRRQPSNGINPILCHDRTPKICDIHWVIRFSRYRHRYVRAQYLYEDNIVNSLYRFVIYRMYIIWGNNKWICILPAITVATLMVAGPGCLVTFSRLAVGENIFVSVAQPYVMLSLGSSLM